MKASEFINELKTLIEKYNQSNDSIITEIDINKSIYMDWEGEKEVKYNINFTVEQTKR